jgi:uncharacterized protein (TIGR02001 family)
MKRTIILLSAITLATGMFSASLHAVEGLSANAAVTSNYMWRGKTQTEDQAAVSGGVDFNAKSGFYVGAWASNVKYGTATAELDLYIGYGFSVNDFTFDVGYLNYVYPAGDDLDFSEVYGSVSWEFLTVGYNVLANSDAGGDFGDDDYVFADLAFEVSDGLELGFHYGTSSYDAGGDYSDYGVSLSKNGFTFAITDTDVKGDDMHVAVSYSIDFDL